MTELAEMLSNSRNIVFFGGAGVSTESNIPDFRSEDGIYNTISKYGYSPEYMLSHSYFMSHMAEFYDYYKNNLIFTAAKPNKAHLALASLERKGVLKAVVTQNIDGLHQAAGSNNVFELHGSVHRNRCMGCGQKFSLDYILKYDGVVPLCNKCNRPVRPEVTLYEESLDMEVMEKAISFIQRADVLIVGGTSLAVYPAAGLINYYKGNRLVLINKSQTPYDYKASLVINDSIGKVLGEAVAGL